MKSLIDYISTDNVLEFRANRSSSIDDTRPEFPKEIEEIDFRSLGKLFGCLEIYGFTWMPFNSTRMNFSGLNKEFGSNLKYTEGDPIDNPTGSVRRYIIPKWVAFGNGERVYRIVIDKYSDDLRHIWYDFEVRRKDGICITFQSFEQFRQSVVKFFGMH